MKKKFGLALAIFALVLTGCAKEQIYSSSPPMKTVSNDLYEATLEPLKAERYNYYNSFRFTFTNKTGKDLIIDWSDTFYLQNKRKYGLFGWEGLSFEELRGLQEEPDLVVAGGKTEATVIFPLKLIGWKEEGVKMKSNEPETGFTLGIITPGQNGMSLAVRQDGKLVRETILVTIALD
ncbi:MAG: hypothetical protein PVH37_05750 [Desulfobacterales bacterium]|jgi:hypothetical protein